MWSPVIHTKLNWAHITQTGNPFVPQCFQWPSVFSIPKCVCLCVFKWVCNGPWGPKLRTHFRTLILLGNTCHSLCLCVCVCVFLFFYLCEDSVCHLLWTLTKCILASSWNSQFCFQNSLYLSLSLFFFYTNRKPD